MGNNKSLAQLAELADRSYYYLVPITMDDIMEPGNYSKGVLHIALDKIDKKSLDVLTFATLSTAINQIGTLGLIHVKNIAMLYGGYWKDEYGVSWFLI